MFYHNFNIGRLFEKKDHLINRLNLTPEQKEKLIAFFNKYPNYENKIDWNRRDLTWEDFQDLLAMEGKSNSSARKNGVAGLIEGVDYKIVLEDSDRVIYKVLTHRASRTLASDKVGTSTVGKWCISMNEDNYWRDYTNRGREFYFIIRKRPLHTLAKYNKVAICVFGKKALSKIKPVQWANDWYNPQLRVSINVFDAEDHSTAWTALPKEDCKFVSDLFKKTEDDCLEVLNQGKPAGTKEERIKAALTGGPKMYFGTRQCHYLFNKPTPNSLYVQILNRLKNNGPMKKYDILLSVADTRPNSWGGDSSWYRSIGVANLRGQYSGVYAAMQQAGLIQYSKSHRGYVELGPNAELYMNYHKELFK